MKKTLCKYYKNGAGFTIIELLVVVAIIAVLTGIVLVNVTQYIIRARDSSAQGNLASMLTNSAVFYDATSTYTNFYTGALATQTLAAGTPANCTGDSTFVGPCQSIITNSATNGYALTISCGNNAGTGVACNAAGVTNWCGQVTLKNGGNTFCVDSRGTKLNKAGGTCTATNPNAGRCM